MTRRSRLLEKLKQLETGPKRALGQNFLVSDGVIDRILDRARRPGFSELLEIGPGLGALTEGLRDIAEENNVPFKVIELDRAFALDWRDQGLQVIEGDALKINWENLSLRAGARLVSNLPYQISSSLVIDRSVWPFGVSTMILMFQKEVAKRIAAQKSTEDYGLLSVIAQTGWSIDPVSEAGPGDFFPPPRVASRVLFFERRPAAPSSVEFESFLRFTKAAYSHRRKLLVKNLSSLVDRREVLETILKDLGHSVQARAEELSPDEMLEYFRLLERQKMAGANR